jgi:hypothetical protein
MLSLLLFLGRPRATVTQKKRLLESSPSGLAVLSAIEDVHRDFKAKAHFGVFGFGPHGEAPSES